MSFNQNQWQQQQQQPLYSQGPLGGFPVAGSDFLTYYPTPVDQQGQQPGYSYGPTVGYTQNQSQRAYAVYFDQPKPDVGRRYANANDGDFDFSDDSVCAMSIRKVYSIWMVQLLVVAGFICVFKFNETVEQYTRRNAIFYRGACFVTCILGLLVVCVGKVRRKPPINFIFFILFTVSVGLLLGTFSSSHSPDGILIGVGIITVIFLGWIVFSFSRQPKLGFHGIGPYLLVILLSLIICGILIMCVPQLPIVRKVYASFLALIFSLYMVFDTQMMLEGRKNYFFSYFYLMTWSTCLPR